MLTTYRYATRSSYEKPPSISSFSEEAPDASTIQNSRKKPRIHKFDECASLSSSRAEPLSKVVDMCGSIIHGGDHFAETILPMLDSFDIAHFSQVNRAWSQQVITQLTNDFGLRNLSAQEEKILRKYLKDTITLIEGRKKAKEVLNRLHPSDTQSLAKHIFAYVNTLFAKIAKTPERKKEIFKIIDDKVNRLLGDLELLEQLSPEQRRNFQPHLEEEKRKMKASVLGPNDVERRKLIEAINTVLQSLKNSAPIFRGYMIDAATRHGQMDLVNCLLRIEEIPRTKKLFPEHRGAALIVAAGMKENPKMVKAILNSGPIPEGSLLKNSKRGFVKEQLSMRSQAIRFAANKGHTKNLESILNQKQILTTDSILEKTLSQAVMNKQYRVIELLLRKIPFTSSAISEVRILAEGDKKINKLLQLFGDGFPEEEKQ